MEKRALARFLSSGDGEFLVRGPSAEEGLLVTASDWCANFPVGVWVCIIDSVSMRGCHKLRICVIVRTNVHIRIDAVIACRHARVYACCCFTLFSGVSLVVATPDCIVE